jgi:hypothetical protein
MELLMGPRRMPRIKSPDVPENWDYDQSVKKVRGMMEELERLAIKINENIEIT